MRSQIREIEDRRKDDKLHDLLLNSPTKKIAKNAANIRKVGTKFAILTDEIEDAEKPQLPEIPKLEPKRVRTILDLFEAPAENIYDVKAPKLQSQPFSMLGSNESSSGIEISGWKVSLINFIRSSDSDDEFVDVSDEEDANQNFRVSPIKSSKPKIAKEPPKLPLANPLGIVGFDQFLAVQNEPSKTSSQSKPLFYQKEKVGNDSFVEKSTDRILPENSSEIELDSNIRDSELQMDLEKAIQLSLQAESKSDTEISSEDDFATVNEPKNEEFIPQDIAKLGSDNESEEPSSSKTGNLEINSEPKPARKENILAMLAKQREELLKSQTVSQKIALEQKMKEAEKMENIETVKEDGLEYKVEKTARDLKELDEKPQNNDNTEKIESQIKEEPEPNNLLSNIEEQKPSSPKKISEEEIQACFSIYCA